MIKREEIIGDCRLLLGDCREILPTLGKVDAVVTDPPYGISDAPIKGQDRTGKRTGSANDWHPPSDWDKALDPEWGSAVCEVAEIIAWFGQWRKREEIANFMPWPLRAEIVWAKDCHMGPPSPVAPRDERIWIFAKDGVKGATFETSVWDCPVIPTWAHKHHKNEKPVALMDRLLRWLAPSVACDPFMGSGTTGVAAVRCGIAFVGIEKDEGYFDIACKRIRDEYARPRLALEPAPQPVQEPLL